METPVLTLALFFPLLQLTYYPLVVYMREREREREREMHLMTSVYCFNNNVISYIFENGLYLICISRCQFIIFVIEGKVLDLLILVAAARTDSLLLSVALKFLN